MIDFILTNWLLIVTGVVTGASIVAKAVPRSPASKFFEMVLKVLHTLALNTEPPKPRTPISPTKTGPGQ